MEEDEEEEEEGEGGGEEEESDMELAWKMLETARLIHEKQPGHTVEEADVITTLADISTERGTTAFPPAHVSKGMGLV